MNRPRGLLAFLCFALAAACALLQIPIVPGIEELGRAFAGAQREWPHPIEVAFTPPTASSIPSGPGGTPALTIYALRRERRADDELRTLAQRARVPFEVLKAHLAQASAGVLDTDGVYWARLPEGDEALPNDGPPRTRAAADLLGRFREETGSVEGALLAWKAGAERAGRVARPLGPQAGLDATLTALRRRMLAPYRSGAESWLCTVHAVAIGLTATWPVADTATDETGLSAVRLASRKGEALRAPMPGRIGWSGPDGSRGTCVEIRHGCDLRSEFCGLASSAVRRGQPIATGDVLGTAGAKGPLFGLWFGDLPLDPTSLIPPAAPEGGGGS